MKTWILALVMIVGLGASAQDKEMKHDREPFTAEQKAELQSKKMALALDLSEKQQKEIQTLLLDRSKKREQVKSQYKANKEAGKKLTTTERFAMKNKMLDEKIAFKSDVKKILNADQYSKWESIKKQSKHKFKERHKKTHKERRR